MRKHFYPYLLCLGLAASPALSVAQQNPAQSYNLLFQNGSFTPPALANPLRMPAALTGPAEANNYYFRVLQFWQIPTQEQREHIESLGIRLHQYLPHNAYMASVPASISAEAVAQLNLRTVFELEPAHKLSQALLTQEYPQWALRENNQIEVVLQYFPTLNAEQAEALVKATGAQIMGRYDFSQQITVRVPLSQVQEIAGLSFVCYVEPIDPPADPENLVGRTSHRSNAIATDYAMGRHYDGTGVQVALGDDGIIGPHIDYQGRNFQGNVNSNDGDHGDHVAGIIMGAGNRDPKARGMASGADLHVYDVWDAIYNTDGANGSYNTLGVRITSLSYGNGCNAGYTGFARTVDQQTRQMPSLIHVFSAGNSGTTNCSYGAGSNWGNVTGGVKVGKNVLAVANMTYTDGISNSSSRGPAKDGRIKPDIAAVGSSVYSTIDEHTYGNKSGTSMACPGVSGTLAQLYQAYRELNNGADPDAGLIKATVLNTADDMGNPGPDFTYGYGKINALRAVRVFEDQTYQIDSLTQGGANTHQLTVPAGTKEVRVMVYWTDFEGAPNVSVALVNNLNMTLTDANGTTYQPWVLNHAPNASTLNAPATRGPDNLNNMEQVTLTDPTPGVFSVNVAGAAIPQGPQKYYVVYTFVTEAPELIYPMGGEALVPGTLETIRWDAYGTTGNFQLEYSADSGATWNSISTAVAGSQRHHNWLVPPALLTGKGLVKITRGTMSDTSNAVFSAIRVPANLEIVYVCPDSLELQWDAVTGATAYEVSRLGQKYMDSVATTTATSVTLYGINASQPDWFSVKAIGPDNGKGRRALAIQKPAGVQNCAIDGAVTAITSPVSGCFTGTNTQVCLTLQNPGASPITDIQVSLSINSGMPIVLNLPGSLGVGATLNHCFPAGLLNLNSSGPVQIAASLIVPSDIDFSNNTFTVNPVLTLPPVANFTFTNTDLAFTFTPAPAGTVTYAWNFGDGNTLNNVANPTHTYAAGGTYNVTMVVTDPTGCQSNITLPVSVISAVSAEVNAQLKLFPNPASGEVLVEWPQHKGSGLQLEVLNMLGQVLHTAQLSQKQQRLQLGHLPQGTYLIRLTGESQTAVARLVLQR